ncbi:hypothetical protein WJX84_009450 [Apatococcus fuscideae]|uniref:Ubiquinone biosynthesis protein COQ4 homolog, mitochondrial n=1 Tax=Apatococcus fuscideae TaxID=2026836 RepID=A0AAW1TAD2_9CHLO
MALKIAKRGIDSHAGPIGVPAAASVVVCCAVWAFKQWKRRRQDRDSPPPAETAVSATDVQGAAGQWASVASQEGQTEASTEEEEAFAQQGEPSSSGRLPTPDPLELLLYEEVVPLSVAEVWAWTQRPLGRVAVELHIRKRNKPVSASGWHTSGDGKLQKSTEYITPLKKVSFGPAEALCCEQKTLQHRGPSGFLVSVAVHTPKVPYGDAFHTRLQIWASQHAAGQTRLRISGDMCFTRKLMLGRIIKSSTFEGMRTTYQLFAEIMHQQLQQHQQASGATFRGLPSLKLSKLEHSGLPRSAPSTSSGAAALQHPPALGAQPGSAVWQLLGIAALLVLLTSAAGFPAPSDSEELTPGAQAAATQARLPYETFQPLNTAQRAVLTLTSAFGALMSPARADLVGTLGELTGEGAFERMRKTMQADPIGQRILAERPLMTDAELEKAHSMPEGSFGKAYAQFMGVRSFRADDRPPVRFIADPELAYVALRARQVHDFWHVLFACPTTVLGELAVKAVEFVQTGLPMTGLAVAGAQWRLKPDQRQRLMSELLPWALRAGTRCHDLMCIHYEEHFSDDLDALRRQFRIQKAPLTWKRL